MSRPVSTDYLYASSRTRAMELRLIGRERVERLVSARSLDAAGAMLAEWGLKCPETLSDPAQREAMLSDYLDEAYRETEGMAADPAIIRLFRYPYDNNNLKAIMKCGIRGLDPADMLLSCGTVSPGALTQALAEGGGLSPRTLSLLPHALPSHMAAAVEEAQTAYAETKNPQLIDFIMDRACYQDMLEAARETKVAFLVELISSRIDLTNLTTLLRILRLGLKNTEVALSLLSDALLPGGSLSLSVLTEWYRAGEGQLAASLAATPYSALANVLTLTSDPAPLYVFERACDDCYLSLLEKVKYVSFGPEILIGYLSAVEASVKNVRIVLAGIAAGLDVSVIRERIRLSYV